MEARPTICEILIHRLEDAARLLKTWNEMFTHLERQALLSGIQPELSCCKPVIIDLEDRPPYEGQVFLQFHAPAYIHEQFLEMVQKQGVCLQEVQGIPMVLTRYILCTKNGAPLNGPF